jgi:CheY-like chemotaxis protein
MPKRILIVEDDLDFGELLSEILETSGFVTATVADGLAALEHLRTHERPDVIMLDLMMPRMDGWQFRREQAKTPELAKIPVIVMSADGSVGRKATEIHADGYFMKPPDLGRLFRELERVAGPTRAGEAVAR